MYMRVYKYGGYYKVKSLIDKEKFDEYQVDTSFNKNEHACFFDLIRKKLIEAKPEEVFRQKFINFLIHELKVPEELIAIELPIKNTNNENRFADVVIFYVDDEGEHVFMVIELKAPNVAISDKVWDQALSYAEILEPRYVLVSNSNITEAIKYDNSLSNYTLIDRVSSYEEILDIESIPVCNQDFRWQRPVYQEVYDEKTTQYFLEEAWIGEDTKKSCIPLLLTSKVFYKMIFWRYLTLRLRILKY